MELLMCMTVKIDAGYNQPGGYSLAECVPDETEKECYLQVAELWVQQKYSELPALFVAHVQGRDLSAELGADWSTGFEFEPSPELLRRLLFQAFLEAGLPDERAIKPDLATTWMRTVVYSATEADYFRLATALNNLDARFFHFVQKALGVRMIHLAWTKKISWQVDIKQAVHGYMHALSQRHMARDLDATLRMVSERVRPHVFCIAVLNARQVHARGNASLNPLAAETPQWMQNGYSADSHLNKVAEWRRVYHAIEQWTEEFRAGFCEQSETGQVEAVLLKRASVSKLSREACRAGNYVTSSILLEQFELARPDIAKAISISGILKRPRYLSRKFWESYLLLRCQTVDNPLICFTGTDIRNKSRAIIKLRIEGAREDALPILVPKRNAERLPHAGIFDEEEDADFEPSPKRRA